MYNFTKQQTTIIAEGKKYGVIININPTTNALYFGGSYKGSDGVRSSLTKKITTYNNHLAAGH